MKRLFFHMLSLVVGVILSNNLTAQNPNWTLPGFFFQPDITAYGSLPQSPPDPVTGIPETDPTLAYRLTDVSGRVLQQGRISTNGTLQTEGLKSGFYLLTLDDMGVYKFIRQ